MDILLALLIVAAPAGSATSVAGASSVFECDFEADADRNFDGWPDDWARRRGPGFPHYVGVRMSRDPAAAGNGCLRVDLDGGGAVLYSPPIEIRRGYSYVVQASLKTLGLKHDQAFVSITWLDEKESPLGVQYSQRHRGDTPWTPVTIGPIPAPGEAARYAVIGLWVQPGQREDLSGQAWFDAVNLFQIPWMETRVNGPLNILTDPAKVEVTVHVTGLTDSAGRLTLRVFDELDQPVGAAWRRPIGQDAGDGQRGEHIVWRPPIADFGYYRIRAELSENGRQRSRATRRSLWARRCNFTYAAVSVGPCRVEGIPFRSKSLAELLEQAEVNWVKLPLWREAQDRELEALARFAGELATRDINLVGLLNDPPASVREKLGDRPATAAHVFTADPTRWEPVLQPTVTRLAINVHWWQLGADTDESFVGFPNLSGRLREIKLAFDRPGLDVALSLPWTGRRSAPAAENPPWRAVDFADSPRLTNDEIAARLGEPLAPAVAQWISIEPPPRGAGTVETRATELVLQMVEAKTQNADAIFLNDPFHPQHGLLNADGTPSELFLPWRTAAAALGGAQYLGAIQFPGGSQNRVFAHGNEVIVVVWNAAPGDEVLYLGHAAHRVDLWGRSRPLAESGSRQVLPVGPQPVIVMGADPGVTRTRLSCRLTQAEFPNVFGRRHQTSLTWKNFFTGPIQGSVRLHGPDGWRIAPLSMPFQAAHAEPVAQPFEFQLRYSAGAGRQTTQFDFDLMADRHYVFSVYRELQVGLDDIGLAMSTRLETDGALVVEQRMTNHGAEPAEFECNLYAPGRRRLRMRTARLGPSPDVRIYRLPEARDLLGATLWLRAEEIGGARVISRRFVVKE